MAKTIDLSKSLDEIIKEEKKTKKMKRPGDAKWKNKKTKNDNHNHKNNKNDVFIKRKQIIIKGREKKSKPQGGRQEQQKKSFKSNSLLVSNIANGIKIEELKTLFESIGQLKKCEFDKNEQGKPLGTARV